MAITHRKGDYADFDPNKMLPGEIAVVRSGDPKARDGRSIYAAFEAGVVKRMATYEDMVENIEAATDEAAEEVVKQAAAGLLAATESANEAANLANEKASDAQKAAASASSAASSANTAAQQANEAANAANAAAANSRNYEGTLETFPESGSTGILYIDKETGLLYIWETTSGSYMLVGGGSSDNIVFLPYSEFPVNGDPEALYVDTSATDSLKMYRWNGTAYIESKKESGSDIVADAFDEEKDYPVGDYCIKDNVLYKFPNGKEPGPWDDSAAVATTCSEEFKSLNSNVEWKKYGEVTGKYAVSACPEGANELLILVNLAGSTNIVTGHVLIPMLGESTCYLRFGAQDNGTMFSAVVLIKPVTRNIEIVRAYAGSSSDCGSTSKLTTYYR